MYPYKVDAADLMQLMTKTIEAGTPIADILQQLELPTNLLDDPKQLVGMEDAWRIMLAAQNAVHEETLLMSSRPLRRGTTRLVFSSLQSCETLEEGLNALADNYNIIHGGQFNTVHKSGHTIRYCVDDREFHYQSQSSHLAIEFALIKIHCVLSLLCSQPLHLLHMHSKREVLPSHSHHLLLFDTALQTKQNQYELCYAASDAQRPLNHSIDLELVDMAHDHYIDLLKQQTQDLTHSFAQECLHQIRLLSAKQQLANQELIAAQFHISVATLRRRLGAQGFNFRQLLDKVNGELALNGLNEGRRAQDIANSLGYSDERSFKRAFKRWFKVSPAQYIKQLKQ